MIWEYIIIIEYSK